jgi:hypothetical protein
MSFALDALAQLGSEYQQPLLTYGPLGVMTLWFMLRGEKIANGVISELRDLSHRMDGITRAMLADVLTREGANEYAKKFVADQLAKIEARDEKDRKR